MALAPRTVQDIPVRLRREVFTFLHPASMTPEPTKRCCHHCRIRWRGARPLAFRFSPYPAGASCGLSSSPSASLRHWGIPSSQLPQMLTSVVKVDNLNRARNVLGGQIPDPFGTGASPPSFGHGSNPASRLPGNGVCPNSWAVLMAPRMGSGIRVADGIALLIHVVGVTHTPTRASRVWAGWPWQIFR